MTCPCPDGCNGCERIVCLVYLCGATDCWPHAMFHNMDTAKKWAEENSNNPEGWIVRSVLLDDIPKLWVET